MKIIREYRIPCGEYYDIIKPICLKYKGRYSSSASGIPGQPGTNFPCGYLFHDRRLASKAQKEIKAALTPSEATV